MSRRPNEKEVAEFVVWRWPDHEPTRAFVFKTWRSFNQQGLAKGNFVSDLVSKDDSKLFQRLWEMVLALHLIKQGFAIQSHESGPDFSFDLDGEKVWIEATAPEPCDTIKERYNRQGGPVPHEQILLRWTSALANKRGRFLEYLNKDIVRSNDICIIAINGHMLHEARGISMLPYAVEAVFPIGPLAVSINRRTSESSELYNSERRSVRKSSGTDVSTDSFLKRENSYVSAIVGCFPCWHPSPFFEMTIVHNPFAENRFPYKRFGAKFEYVCELGQDEDSIKRI